jgi:hypothetical protein
MCPWKMKSSFYPPTFSSADFSRHTVLAFKWVRGLPSVKPYPRTMDVYGCVCL